VSIPEREVVVSIHTKESKISSNDFQFNGTIVKATSTKQNGTLRNEKSKVGIIGN
jgi:hypothetical protein